MPRPLSHLPLAFAKLVICLILAATGVPSLDAAQVLVVLSSDKAPYQLAVEGLRYLRTAK